MVDKVKALKFENPSSGGSETDIFPTEINVSEDFLAGKGVSFEGLDSYLLEKVGGVIKDYTPNYSHKYIYTGDLVTAYEIYNGFTQTTPNRLLRNDLTYTGDDLSSESIKIYDMADGTTILKTITINHTFTSNLAQKSEATEV